MNTEDVSRDEQAYVRAYREHLASDPEAAHLHKLIARHRWLTARIQAKRKVGWDIVWDTAERDALGWALRRLGVSGNDLAATESDVSLK